MCESQDTRSYWFQCSCSYRWEGHTQSAKTLAFKLHSKICDDAKGAALTNMAWKPMSNAEGKPDTVTRNLRMAGFVVLNDGTVYSAPDAYLRARES